ncbi:polysaccharide deacetylase family protein [Dyadobacter diqingensis]|uniref:polysaccharide deacetylase family protein n=1 Tax=Dyadobacter diqingensis TaxID=2938121 RepID=UPI0020C2AC93|nr:polysaccharide deacetylase family protein [Dyadobacter diqingensis]
MKKVFLLFISCALANFANAQRSVSVTIDDVPNTRLYQLQNFSSPLQQKLDSLQIPVAIFINEGNLEQTTALEKNRNLLKSWLSKSYVTAGNHGFAHKNYAEVGLEAFKEDVIKGEVLTKSFLKEFNKESRYFRFPYNGAGNDSLEQLTAQKFLKEKNYISTPFTVESEDWLHAILYDKALAENDRKRAEWIGDQYVNLTLKLFSHFDSLSVSIYNRPIRQIYLCHDNSLNADYLPRIVDELKNKNYEFVSLDNALLDPVYQSQLYYYGKAGFSWIYKWMPDVAARRKLMRSEPSNPEIQKAFEDLNKQK